MSVDRCQGVQGTQPPPAQVDREAHYRMRRLLRLGRLRVAVTPYKPPPSICRCCGAETVQYGIAVFGSGGGSMTCSSETCVRCLEGGCACGGSEVTEAREVHYLCGHM